MLNYRVLAVLWALVMLAVTILPGTAIEPVGRMPLISAVFHIGEFLIFGWLLAKAFPNISSPLLISLAYSAFTEILQLYVPGRFFSYTDIALNMAGSVSGIGAPFALQENNILLQFKNKLTSWFNDRNP